MPCEKHCDGPLERLLVPALFGHVIGREPVFAEVVEPPTSDVWLFVLVRLEELSADEPELAIQTSKMRDAKF